MTRHLILSGGPAHDFAGTARWLTELVDDSVDGAAVVVDRPDEAFALLRSVEAGVVEPFDLLTVHALHWNMANDRYAQLREEHGFTLQPDDAALMDRFVTGGGGLLALHTAVICFDASPLWRALIGGSWNWGTSSHGPPRRANVVVTNAGRLHRITQDTETFAVLDEFYENLDLVPAVVPLLVTTHDGRDYPLMWAQEFGRGRVVTHILGHDVESLDEPAHGALLRRAALWVTDQARTGE